MKRYITALFVWSFVVNTTGSNIVIDGSISAFTVWDTDTVKVTGDLTIENGVTLKINAGTFVEFQGNYCFNIQGRIIAQGNVSDSIVFTTVDTTIGWKGIRFENTPESNDTSFLSYCKIQYVRVDYAEKKIFSGAVYMKDFSRLVLSNSVLKYNKIYGLSSIGAGIHCRNSSPVLRDLVIAHNSADYGGGMYCDSSDPVLERIQFDNNVAIYGAGLNCTRESSPKLFNVLFSTVYRSADQGGGIYCEKSSPELTNVVFAGNYANKGGAAFCSNSFPVFINVLFASNRAATGGAAYMYLSSPKFINCTIVNNTSINGGSALQCSFSSPELINTILWNNRSENDSIGVFLSDSSSDPQFSYCDIQYGKTGFGGIGAGDNYKGAFLENMSSDPYFTDTANGDYTLQVNSPCINAGIPDVSGLNLPQTDYAGRNRISENRIDIGAYEYGDISTLKQNTNIKKTHHFAISCFPNPFYQHTVISFDMTSFAVMQGKNVMIQVFGIDGKKIVSLYNAKESATRVSIQWDGRDSYGKGVAAGVYYCTLSFGKQSITKMIVKR